MSLGTRSAPWNTSPKHVAICESVPWLSRSRSLPTGMHRQHPRMLNILFQRSSDGKCAKTLKMSATPRKLHAMMK